MPKSNGIPESLVFEMQMCHEICDVALAVILNILRRLL